MVKLRLKVTVSRSRHLLGWSTEARILLQYAVVAD